MRMRTADVSRDYERTTVIRIDPKTRTVIRSYATVIIGVIALAGGLSVTGVIHNAHQPSTVGIVAASMIGGLGALLFALGRSRVVLRPDSIEVTRYLWPSRRVARTDIVARRVHPAGWRNAPYHIVILQNGSLARLPPYLEHNASLQAWLTGIPLNHDQGFR